MRRYHLLIQEQVFWRFHYELVSLHNKGTFWNTVEEVGKAFFIFFWKGPQKMGTSRKKSDTEVFFSSCRFKLSEGLNKKNFPARHLKQNTLTPEHWPNLTHLATVNLVYQSQRIVRIHKISDRDNGIPSLCLASMKVLG